MQETYKKHHKENILSQMSAISKLTVKINVLFIAFAPKLQKNNNEFIKNNADIITHSPVNIHSCL